MLGENHKNTELYHALHLDKQNQDKLIIISGFCDWFAMSLEKCNCDISKAKIDFNNYVYNVFFKTEKNFYALEIFEKLLKLF